MCTQIDFVFYSLLGGGLGNTRRGGPDQNTKYSGRDDFASRDRYFM